MTGPLQLGVKSGNFEVCANFFFLRPTLSDEFKAYVQKKPEYAKLFTMYQRLATLPETIEADFKSDLCPPQGNVDLERSQAELKQEGAVSKTQDEKKRD